MVRSAGPRANGRVRPGLGRLIVGVVDNDLCSSLQRQICPGASNQANSDHDDT
jgi:hypothetical protein